MWEGKIGPNHGRKLLCIPHAFQVLHLSQSFHVPNATAPFIVSESVVSSFYPSALGLDGRPVWAKFVGKVFRHADLEGRISCLTLQPILFLIPKKKHMKHSKDTKGMKNIKNIKKKGP